jgi:hypothetical protein
MYRIATSSSGANWIRGVAASGVEPTLMPRRS